MIKKRPSPTIASAVYDANTSIPRRVFLRSTAGIIVGAGITASGAQPARAFEKYDRADVAWQDTPKDGQSCENCRFWDGNGGCEIVAGEFEPDDWCAVWAPM